MKAEKEAKKKKTYKVKVSEKTYYEIKVDADNEEEAEEKILGFDVDYTKGRECSSDEEFKHLAKHWIESVEEITS